MSRYHSPLRYPGGKAVLSNFLRKVIELNGIADGVYAEPFAGGAGSALALLYSEHVQEIILNDVDKNIYAFWHSVLGNTDEFIKLIWETPVTIKEREQQKNILLNYNDYTLTEVGFAAFYLNRCNRSGILNAGPIGGNEQSGKWKIDARFNKTDLAKRIEMIGLYNKRIQVFNYDAIDFVNKKILNRLGENDKILVYFDPPYFQNGHQLYLNYYTDKDHIILSNFLKNLTSFHWVLTYDDVPEVRNLYSNYIRQSLKLNYSANRVRKGDDLLMSSENCLLPKFPV